MKDASYLKFLERVVPRPLFIVELLVFQVMEVNCVRLGVLLLAKLNFLCLEMFVTPFFFWSSTNSELNFYKTRSLLLKILDVFFFPASLATTPSIWWRMLDQDVKLITWPSDVMNGASVVLQSIHAMGVWRLASRKQEFARINFACIRWLFY